MWIATVFILGLVASADTVSLQSSSWLALEFSKIKPNRVSFVDGTIIIDVKGSAGPIVQKLPQPITITEIHVKGRVSGIKTVESSAFDEDSVLRLGVVAEGKQTLSGPKRWFAADWVKKLFQLAPPGAGIDKIHFFAITNRTEMVGKHRLHPKSDLITETITHFLSKDGDFDFTYPLEKPIRTVGLWISVDGDDSNSTFSTTISNIDLN